jgi:nucleoside-diphosphate-sugar epimerase
MNRPLLTVFGARRGLGLAIARSARLAGWDVTAVVRPGADASEAVAAGCRISAADALDAAAVTACFAAERRKGWVVSALGAQDTRVDDQGNRNIIDAVKAHGGSGLLLISSLGAGDSREYASVRLLQAIGPVLEAKTRAEEHLRASGIDFAIIRPGGLVDGIVTKTGQLVEQQDVHGFIAREELARLALALLTDKRLAGQTLAAIDPRCPPPARYR